MRRLTAAVATTAAVLVALVGNAVSAAVHTAVRAEVVLPREGHTLDVRQIRIVDGLRPGESYRLPTFSIRNHRGVRTAYRLVASAGEARGDRRPPQGWLRFVPAAVAIDAGRTHAVGVRLEVPGDAAPGAYAVVLGARPGSSEGARLTFRIVPAESARTWRVATHPAVWVVPALVGAVLVVFLVRVGAWTTGSNRQKSASLSHAESTGEKATDLHG